MEWDIDQRAPGCWCIAAKLSKNAPPEDRRAGYDTFGPGASVFCMPPARNDPEGDVRVVGYTSRLHRLVHSTIPANHLKIWHPEYVTDRRVMEAIAPPWDDKDESRAMASLICSWQDGGPWPAVELRDWNRTHGQRVVARGGFIKRLLHRFVGTSKREKPRRAQ